MPTSDVSLPCSRLSWLIEPLTRNPIGLFCDSRPIAPPPWKPLVYSRSTLPHGSVAPPKTAQ